VADSWMAMVLGLLIFGASVVSVELGISVTLIEIILGVIGGNYIGLHATPWIDYLAGFGGIVLTFLAGAEVDTAVLREKFAASVVIGGLSFLLPFLGAWGMSLWLLHWPLGAAKITGIECSSRSLSRPSF